MRKGFVPVVLTVLVFILIGSFGRIILFYTDWLWFQEVNLEVIFLRSLTAKVWIGLISGAIFFFVLLINYFLARKLAPDTVYHTEKDFIETLKLDVSSVFFRYGILLVPGILLLSIFAGAGAASNWDIFLRYINPTMFGSTCRRMMRRSDAPMETAARTNTCSRTDSTPARVIRAKMGV